VNSRQPPLAEPRVASREATSQPVEDQEIERPPGTRSFIGAAVGVAAVVLLFAVLYVTKLDREVFAGLGNAMGVLAALFSGLAFAGVIYALVMQRAELRLQRRELELQRRELSLTRQEIAGQRGEMERQNLTLQRQAHDAAFYQLLRFQRDALRAIQARPQGAQHDVFNGISAINVAAEKLEGHLSNLTPPIENAHIARNVIGGYHWITCLTPYSDFSQYFGTLLNTLRYADGAPEFLSHHFAAIVRSQLSHRELLLVFTHGIYARQSAEPEDDPGEWNILIAKYALFSEWSLGKPLLHLETLYPPAAFGLERHRLEMQPPPPELETSETDSARD
jgi:hypothetical protein